MNRRQKIVQEQFLNNEEAVIKRLTQVYTQSLKDVTAKSQKLYEDIESLTAVYDTVEDEAEKAVLKSRIQSKVYQKQYQDSLKKQVSDILDDMHEKSYTTVADYLDQCYEDGFVGALYDIQGQGIPLAFPLDQESMVRAVQLDSKISSGLYNHLREDIGKLKKNITAQVSRGISSGMTFKQIAQQLSMKMTGQYKNPGGSLYYATRIARTEGHRIQCQAGMDACYKAKEKGADVVKQWDATLDGKTRTSHINVDGQIRELDEKFSNGLMFPGDPSGEAAEVCNCRCALHQRARWALDSGFTKMNNFTKQLETFDSPEAYEEFKKGFFSPENKKYMNYVQDKEKKYNTKDFRKVLDKMDTREYNHYSRLFDNNPLYNKNAIKAIKTPGEIGEKAIPYSQRGIEVDSHIKEYMKQLKKNGDYISGVAGSFKNQDLAVLTTETGVEYVALTIGKKSVLVRGTDKGTDIPKDVLNNLLKQRGTLDCHSHPFIGDLTPSAEDKEFIKTLTWQTESVIIDPTENAVRFTKNGVVEQFRDSKEYEEGFWETLFKEGDADVE